MSLFQDSGEAVEMAGFEPRFCGDPPQSRHCFPGIWLRSGKGPTSKCESGSFGPDLRPKMPTLYWKSGSWFLSLALELEGRRGRPLPSTPSRVFA